MSSGGWNESLELTDIGHNASHYTYVNQMDLRAAANSGECGAQYELGVRYFKGRGAPKDPQESLRWIRLAAENSSVEAQVLMGDIYYATRRMSLHRDYPRYDLADNLAAALGLTDNIHTELLHWYRLAAKQNDSHAQLRLGEIYANAEGSREDFARAASWYRLAAEQDNQDANIGLAELFAKDGVDPKHRAEAGYWYCLLVESGNGEALRNL